MAVVQISRIQIRRGTANGGTGLPQLASGEMAWAVDTQQLFIGNGAVSEGAPAVGNTRILTTADISSYGNLLSGLTYTYEANNSAITTGVSSNSPVSRTFQARLDDRVNTLDFGTVGNGVNDDTAALQRAINELFLNPNQTSSTYNSSYPTGTPTAVSTRITLEIPAGIYYTSQPIFVPSYATLVGAGADHTIIYYNSVGTYTGSTINSSETVTLTSATASMVGATITGTGIATGTTITAVSVGASVTLSQGATATGTGVTFTITLAMPAIQFVNDSSTIGSPSPIIATTGTTQPRNIVVKNLTIHSSSGVNTCLQLDSVKDSLFENLILQGDWNNVVNSNCVGIQMNVTSSLVGCDHNIFRNIRFNNFTYGVYAMGDITNNIFEDCYFNNGYQGVNLGTGSNGSVSGQIYGPRQTQILNSKFYNIKQQAVYLYRGYGNNTTNCKFVNVGNNGAGNTGAIYPQVFWNAYGNTSVNDWSDRGGDLLTSNTTTPYIPEMAGHGIYKSFGTNQLSVGNSSSPNFLFRLPVSMSASGSVTGTINYKIEYYYQSTVNNFSRQGIISIAADVNSSTAAQIQLDDEFDFAGVDAGDTNAVILTFTGGFLDAVGNVYTGAAGQVPSSVAVYYTNNLSGDAGFFGFSYSALQ